MSVVNIKIAFFSLVFTCFGLLLHAQNHEVSYQLYKHGKIDSSYSYSLKFANQIAYLSGEDDQNRAYIDLQRKVIVDIMTFDGTFYKTVIPFSDLNKPVMTNEEEDILGYKCSKAIYKAFSNTIATVQAGFSPH